MSFTTAESISKKERLMAGTPYWRERKLVTSSSERKPSFTSTAPSREPDSFCILTACSNCSGVITFSLTSRSPKRWDMRTSPYLANAAKNYFSNASPHTGAKIFRGKLITQNARVVCCVTQIDNQELLADW